MKSQADPCRELVVSKHTKSSLEGEIRKEELIAEQSSWGKNVSL